MKSKWASQFPIYEQIGISILRDLPDDKIDLHWKNHYYHLKEFYKKYKLFLRVRTNSKNETWARDWVEFVKRNPYQQ